MTVTTTTTYGADFGRDVQANGIAEYINGADYPAAQAEAMLTALFDALRDEVAKRLPEDLVWSPGASEFVYPVGASLPSHEEMDELFTAAWEAVEARYAEIETATIGTPNGTALQVITNVESQEDGYTRGWVVPAGTDPTADLEMGAVAHIDIPSTEDEAAWHQGLRGALTDAGYTLTGPIGRDGAVITGTVTRA